MSMQTPVEHARDFLENETEFRLGALVTERPHPTTEGLTEALQRDTAAGIRGMLAVDGDIEPVASAVFASPGFASLVAKLRAAIAGGNRVYFTGCGATGRLAILLEACWRRACSRLVETGGAEGASAAAPLRDRVVSVMAGGDYALIRSVEGFEDFTDFGRYQLSEAGVSGGDVVVAVTEGGETSFVIGTAWQGVESGASVFFVYNNPTEVLTASVRRSREIIAEPRVTCIDLATGPMAVAGSTRMQATTIELLVLGTALECVLQTLLPRRSGPGGGTPDRGDVAGRAAEEFARLLRDLRSDAAVAALAGMAELEESVYGAGALVTYLADECMLDILTDTTERNPTFQLPPFRKAGDEASPSSWAFVKNPRLATPDAWVDLLQRSPRGLDWGGGVYRRLGAPVALRREPPALNNAEILKFGVGSETDPERCRPPGSTAVLVLSPAECGRPDTAGFVAGCRPFPAVAGVGVGTAERARWTAVADPFFHVPCRIRSSRLGLWGHLARKIVLNTVSTATMGRMGRLVSNLMVYVEPSNKKLIDRSTRLISLLAGIDYDRACVELFNTLASIGAEDSRGGEHVPPVAVTLERLAVERRA